MDYIKIGDLIFRRSPGAADMRLESCAAFRETALDCGSLAFDTMSAEVFTTSAGQQLAGLPAGTPVIVFRGAKVYARYLLTALSRTGANNYALDAQSPMSVLTTMPHPGGIYTGQTVREVVRDICGAVPVIVESAYADVKLYGWLPYCQPPGSSARDNLVQVLFAIGAYLGTDLNGVLRVEKLWDGVASTVSGDRMYLGGSVKTAAKVSAVSVAEHQYTPGSEDAKLYEGTAEQGALVTFSEPMHSLTVTGFSILESGANYAKLSAGTGTLTGKKYIHNTRLVTETVAAGAAENVKSVTDATLVSLVNSRAVAKRLAAYYACRETVSNAIVAGAERPGHVVSIYHPYDRRMVTACIESLDSIMSGTVKSNLDGVVGFVPPQPDTSQYYDKRVVLTGSGTWMVPDGVTAARYVLIGSGGGGSRGQDGAAGEIKSLSFGSTGTFMAGPGAGGAGGAGGAAGLCGKVLQGETELTPGAQIAYSAGPGGTAGQELGEVGQAGTDTTFGTLTSADGTRPESGYADTVTGDTLCLPGAEGVAGGNGGDGGSGGGTGGSGGDAASWTGGAGAEGKSGPLKNQDGTSQGSYSYGGGGGSGAAYGANGKDAPGKAQDDSSPSGSTAYDCADGVDALPHPANPSGSYGSGGAGGNGGSGGGGSGQIKLTLNNYDGGAGYWLPKGGAAGKASVARDGSPGCVILYYREVTTAQSGAVADKGKRWLLDRLGRRIIV